jgi:nicotinamide mononucleotide transporter
MTMDPLELFAVAISLAAVWWTSVRDPICWPVGIASVLVYGWIFIQARLYSDALLQGFFALMNLYGWWVWLRTRSSAPAPGVETAGSRRPPVVRPAPAQLAVPLALGVLGAVALGALMSRYTNAALPWLDASLTALSLVAQFWMARLYRANWVLWIGVDLVYIGQYIARALPLTAALYAVFVVLAGWGWWKWRPQPEGSA